MCVGLFKNQFNNIRMGILRTRVFLFREGDRSCLPEGNSLGVSLELLDRQYNLEQTPHQGTTILNYRSLNKSYFEDRMELFELLTDPV